MNRAPDRDALIRLYRCGRCSWLLKPAKDRAGIFLCRQCPCTCSTAAPCQVHFTCCDWQAPCPYHQLHPRPIAAQLKALPSKHVRRPFFRYLLEEVKEQKQIGRQEEQAQRLCGSCGATLKLRDRQSKVVSPCPNACLCTCAKGNGQCLVHWRCGCDWDGVCDYHLRQHPQVLAKRYAALPAGSRYKVRLKQLIEHRTQWAKGKGMEVFAFQLDEEPAKKASLPGPKKTATVLPLLEAMADKWQVAPSTSQASEPVAVAHDRPLFQELSVKIQDYEQWLFRQSFSPHSQRNYLSRLRSYLEFVKTVDEFYPLLATENKEWAVRDFKQHLKKRAKLKPASVNSYLSAIDSLYSFLGVGPCQTKREELAMEAPLALSAKEEKRLLRAIENTRRVKDRAIMTLLFYTGLRISECAALEVDDVFVVGRKTRVIVRSGKGDRYREVPLNSAVCAVLQQWLAFRKEKYAGRAVSKALFLNPQGGPMTTTSIDRSVHKVAEQCGLSLSAHVLRHNVLTNLVRKKNDIVLVADIAGHRSLNTTKRYSLPSAADKAKAMERLLEPD